MLTYLWPDLPPNARGATWWPYLQPNQVVPTGGQTCKLQSETDNSIAWVCCASGNVCMIYLQKESFVTPEFSFRIGTQTSAAGTLITLLREFGACWGYLQQQQQSDHICFPTNLRKNLTVALSLERLGPRASGLAITNWPGPSSL